MQMPLLDFQIGISDDPTLRGKFSTALFFESAVHKTLLQIQPWDEYQQLQLL